MIGVAILGAGDIANTHIEAYKELWPRCQIRALADVNEEKARRKKEKYGLDCQILKDYRELAGREDISLISICLPPALHCQTAVELLRAGKHILCEKPMAPTLEECDRMLEAQKEGGGILSIVAQNRFKQDVMKTKRLLDSGVLGKKLFAQANSFWWRGENYYRLCWRGTWEQEGGGCTFSHAVHHIDLFLWFMGQMDSVQAMVENENHKGSEVEDVSISMVRFKDGAVGTIVSSLLHHGERQSMLVDAQRGSIEIPHRLCASRQLANGYPADDEEEESRLKEQYSSFPDLKYTGHCGQIDDVLSAIECGTQPLVDGVEGRRTIELISGIYQSAFLGKQVRFPLTETDPFYTKEGILRYARRFHKKGESVESFGDIEISVGGTL